MKGPMIVLTNSIKIKILVGAIERTIREEAGGYSCNCISAEVKERYGYFPDVLETAYALRAEYKRYFLDIEGELPWFWGMSYWTVSEVQGIPASTARVKLQDARAEAIGRFKGYLESLELPSVLSHDEKLDIIDGAIERISNGTNTFSCCALDDVAHDKYSDSANWDGRKLVAHAYQDFMGEGTGREPYWWSRLDDKYAPERIAALTAFRIHITNN